MKQQQRKDEHDAPESLREWNGVPQQPIPVSMPSDAVTVIQLYRFLEEELKKGYGMFPVLWSVDAHFGYVVTLDSNTDAPDAYHRGVMVSGR